VRVLHLINDLSAGGAQSGLFYLLKNSQIIPDFTGEVCVIHQAGEFGEKLRAAGVRIHEFGLHNRFSPSIAFRLHRLIKTGGYHIIHVHLFPGLYWGACLAWMFPGCRWVYTEHSIWNKRRGFSWARWLEGRVYRQYDRIVTISVSARQSLLTWQPCLKDRISIIPNGVELSMFEVSKAQADSMRVKLDVDSDTKVIFYAGRLVKEKGVDVLLKAAASFGNFNWRLFLAGDGPEMAHLKTLCFNLGLGDKVNFLGWRVDIPELMAASDLVVLPSRWEGLPLSLLEAMAAGKPVVACDVGGVSEVIRDNEEGFLVAPENPEAIKEAITKIILDPCLAQSMGDAGRQRVKDYSVPEVARQLHSLYVKLL